MDDRRPRGCLHDLWTKARKFLKTGAHPYQPARSRRPRPAVGPRCAGVASQWLVASVLIAVSANVPCREPSTRKFRYLDLAPDQFRDPKGAVRKKTARRVRSFATCSIWQCDKDVSLAKRAN